MNALVVLFALASVACGSLVPLAQPPHHPAVVLDPHGRPLDTAEVINARAVHLQAKALEHHNAHLVHAAVAPVVHSIAPAVIAAPAAVSHQSRVDVHSSPAIVSHAIATPVLAQSVIAPVFAHSALGVVHGHLLKKRSLALLAPSAVSHQSRVDVISKAAVAHAVAAPIVAHSVVSPVLAHAVPAPIVAVVPSAVSHESRVDVHSSPVVVAHSAITPFSSIWAGETYGAHSLAHGHLLKKRSLAVVAPVVHSVPAAVSHQSRVDVISEPAVVSHQVVAPVVATAPLAHSAIWTAPVARLGYSGLFKGLW